MFGSDNQEIVHPLVMEQIARANSQIAPSYGADNFTKFAEDKIREIFETNDVDIYFVTTGGAANCLGLASICPNWGAILCHTHAHIYQDEGNGPEMFTGGARLIPIGNGLKLLPDDIEKALIAHDENFVHAPQPKVISISNLNENGLCYTPMEIAKISQIAKAKKLWLHCDGARFANALAFTNASPKELSWQSGVDVLSFGLTKNGAMIAEAVLIFGQARNQSTKYLRKSAQQLISKHRFLAAQFIAMLENNLWLECAQNANSQAQALGQIFTKHQIEIISAIEGNEVFVKLSNSIAQKLENAQITFYPWHIGGENTYRFVTSWATKDENIAQIDKILKE
jgi:threonine aldolase